MAPAAPESQRVSGEVIGGSGIEQVMTEIDFGQGAEAVEHSAGSALEHLALAPSTAGYPDQFAEPATEFSAPNEIPVAQVVAIPAPAPMKAAVPMARPATAPAAPSALALYVLSPIAMLVTLGGLALAVLTLLNPIPADATDFARVDLHIQQMTRLLLGGLVFVAGLLIFVAAALAQVHRSVKSRG